MPAQTTDVSTFIGPYPFRYLPHPDPEVLVRVLAREGIADAWVGHLPSAFYRDPTHGNEAPSAAGSAKGPPTAMMAWTSSGA